LEIHFWGAGAEVGGCGIVAGEERDDRCSGCGNEEEESEEGLRLHLEWLG
jgi:hypothetical protein